MKVKAEGPTNRWEFNLALQLFPLLVPFFAAF